MDDPPAFDAAALADQARAWLTLAVRDGRALDARRWLRLQGDLDALAARDADKDEIRLDPGPPDPLAPPDPTLPSRAPEANPPAATRRPMAMRRLDSLDSLDSNFFRDSSAPLLDSPGSPMTPPRPASMGP